MAVRRLLQVLLVLPLVVAACSGSTTGGATKGPDNRTVKAGGTLNIALSEDPDALDPTTANTFVSREVFASMCEKLYDVNNTLEIVPQLAASLPKVSSDGLMVTIALRTGVQFTDGTTFDAAAVKKTLDRDRTLPGSSRKSELGAVTAVDVVDPNTVKLTLSRPFSPLAAQLADRAGMVMSPAALDKEGKDFGANPVCVGPFSFVSRTSGNEIVLKKSRDYYDSAKVKLEGITYKIITDPNVRTVNLRSGDVQAGERMATTDVASLQSNPQLKVLAVDTIGYQGITINLSNASGTSSPPGQVNTPLAQHPELRQAFELSLDRAAINKVVFNGLYTPDCSPLPTQSPYRAANLTCSKHDVASAKKLIAQSGVKTPIPVTLLVTANATSERLGQVIQGMAKGAGFDVTVQPQEFVASLKEGRTGQFDTIQVGWSGRVDPDGNTNDLITSGGSNNYSGLHDPIIDDSIHQAAAAMDLKQRTALYTKALEEERKQLGIIYLYHERYYLGLSSKVAGVGFYADGIPRLKTAGFAS
jgi:peptide/nickel transport system substrate-binding protein